MLVVMVGLLSGALWWEGWGRPEAARSSPEQPRRAQESPGEPRRAQESPGEFWSTPRVTKNTSTMTLFLATLVCRFALANLACGARGHPKFSKSAR